jgi:hypothetical protein
MFQFLEHAHAVTCIHIHTQGLQNLADIRFASGGSSSIAPSSILSSLPGLPTVCMHACMCVCKYVCDICTDVCISSIAPSSILSSLPGLPTVCMHVCRYVCGICTDVRMPRVCACMYVYICSEAAQALHLAEFSRYLYALPSLCMYICMYVCVFIYVRMYVLTSICMCVYMHVCMRVHICMYVCVQWPGKII